MGAELYSMIWKASGMEVIWQGDCNWWPDRSPLLFPAVGDWKDNQYQYKGNRYEMPLHGFARFSPFRRLESLDNEIIYLLTADDGTKKYYPFDFALTVVYRITENRLEVIQTVKNNSDQLMPFSIGEHVGIRIPLLRDEVYSDYYLEFEKKETAGRYPLINGRVLGDPVPCLDDTNVLELTREMFQMGAYNFKGLLSEQVTLKNHKNSYSIEMSFPGFEYFSLWSVPGADFICLEPCNGAAASENEGYDILDKKGIRTLKPGCQSIFSYTITIKE